LLQRLDVIDIFAILINTLYKKKTEPTMPSQAIAAGGGKTGHHLNRQSETVIQIPFRGIVVRICNS
jgi:hypothetical protein